MVTATAAYHWRMVRQRSALPSLQARLFELKHNLPGNWLLRVSQPRIVEAQTVERQKKAFGQPLAALLLLLPCMLHLLLLLLLRFLLLVLLWLWLRLRLWLVVVWVLLSLCSKPKHF